MRKITFATITTGVLALKSHDVEIYRDRTTVSHPRAFQLYRHHTAIVVLPQIGNHNEQIFLLFNSHHRDQTFESLGSNPLVEGIPVEKNGECLI